MVHARQGAGGPGAGRRSRSGLRALLRAVTRAADDGARGRAPEGRPLWGGRAAVPAGVARASAQRRCHAPARGDRGRAPGVRTRPSGCSSGRSRLRPISWLRSSTSDVCARSRTASPKHSSPSTARSRSRPTIRRRISCAGRRWRRPRSRTKRSRPTRSASSSSPRTRAHCSDAGMCSRAWVATTRRSHPTMRASASGRIPVRRTGVSPT